MHNRIVEKLLANDIPEVSETSVLYALFKRACTKTISLSESHMSAYIDRYGRTWVIRTDGKRVTHVLPPVLVAEAMVGRTHAMPDYMSVGHGSKFDRVLFFVDSSGAVHKKNFAPGVQDHDHVYEFRNYDGTVLAQGRIDLTRDRGSFSVRTGRDRQLQLAVEALLELMNDYDVEWIVYDGNAEIMSAEQWIHQQFKQ